MTPTDPSPTTQITNEGTSGDQSVQALDPPTLLFVPTFSNVERPSTGQTSVTQVDHEDDEQPVPLLAPEPTSLVIASGTGDVTHEAPEFISALSQDQQESVQQPPVPSTQQTMSETVPQMPQTYLTFLLISGRRRTMSFDPESPIGRVKELAWNSWPTEWQDEHPPAPSYLRVLYLGKMLQDDETLIGLKLPTYTPQPPTSPGSSSPGPIPTIMHLSIRHYAPVTDGDLKKNKRSVNGDANNGGEGESETNCCHCVIS